MKRAAELKPSRKARAQHAELISKQLKAENEPSRPSQPGQLSALESLPTEVFEQIFFHCLELSLPRASPYLAKALSRPAVYSALVLFAYYDAASSISYVELHHFLPARYRQITRDEQVRLQEGMHRCRWFTLELFESCLPALSRLRMVECWHSERKGMISHNAEQLEQNLEENSPLLDPDALLPSLTDNTQMETYFLARILRHQDDLTDGLPEADSPESDQLLVGPQNDEGYLPFVSTTSFWNEDGRPNYRSGRTVLAVRVIPDCVLKGAPWTDAKVKLLQYLRQGMRYEAPDRNLDRHLVISLGALFDGMASAIAEGDDRALLVLLELHSTIVRYPAPVSYGGEPRPIFNIQNDLPLRLFHLVCKLEQSHTIEVQTRQMSLLMRAGIEAIPPDDEIMTRWATHAIKDPRGNELRRWLLSIMESPRTARIYIPSIAPRNFTDEVGYTWVESPSESRWSIYPDQASYNAGGHLGLEP